VQLSWDEPQSNGGFPIVKYRIFVQEKDMSGSPLNILTLDSTTSYKLKTPKAMWGKDYIFSI